jgi:hypothetical protein
MRKDEVCATSSQRRPVTNEPTPFEMLIMTNDPAPASSLTSHCSWGGLRVLPCSLPRSKREMVTMTVTAATRTTTTAATGTTTTTTATMGTTMTTAAAAAAPSLAQSARRRGPLSFLFVLTSHPPTSSLASHCSRGGFLFFSFLFHCCI